MTQGAQLLTPLYDTGTGKLFIGDGNDFHDLLNPEECQSLRTSGTLNGEVVILETEADGDVIFSKGDSEDELIAWDDLRFPASGINPVGAIADPALDMTETGFPGTLLFSGTVDNMSAITAQMPHEWKAGTAIRPHIHWSKPVGSANVTTWELYYRKIGNVGDVAGAWVGPIVGTLTANGVNVADKHSVTTFGSIDMTGGRESAMLSFRLYRRGSTDADNGTARLYEFDIHYQKNKQGTFLEFPAVGD
jgi:hypothetical protein